MYKTLLLLAPTQNHILKISKTSDMQEAPETEPEDGDDNVEISADLVLEACIWLVARLIDLCGYDAAHDWINIVKGFSPSSPASAQLEEYTARRFQAQRNVKLDYGLGGVKHSPYPFMSSRHLRRSNELTKKLQRPSSKRKVCNLMVQTFRPTAP